jgi:hypothetical protein
MALIVIQEKVLLNGSVVALDSVYESLATKMRSGNRPKMEVKNEIKS